MKKVFILLLFLPFVASLLPAQIYLDHFSPISGRMGTLSNMIKTSQGYVLYNRYRERQGGISVTTDRLYRISEDGTLMDSIELTSGGKIRFGGIPFVDDKGKLYFLGFSGLKNVFYSQRYAVFEIDSNFNISREVEFPLFQDHQKSVGVFRLIGQAGVIGLRSDFTIYNDTFYAAGDYWILDSSLNFLGAQYHYFKGTLDGKVLEEHPIYCQGLVSFFRNNHLYVIGLIPTDPSIPFYISPGTFGWFDHNGKLINAWAITDQFPLYMNGGIIDDKFFFSYHDIGSLASGGCPTPTVAIEIRDLNFNFIRRFRVKECGYEYAGNMPFAKAEDGSIYFQAMHPSLRKFLLQKYTSDMQLIWSKEYAVNEPDSYYHPIQIIALDNNKGVLVRCFTYLNDDWRCTLHRISADGEPLTTQVIDLGDGREASVLSPNPCRDVVRYTGDYDRPLMAMVHSMDGRINRMVRLQEGMLDLSTLPPGFYAVLLMDAEQPGRILHQQTIIKAKD